MRLLILLGVVVLLACGRATLTEPGAGGGTGGAGGGGGGGGGSLDGGGASTCHGLALDACRARPDCVADFCFICTCTPRYEGCRGVDDVPHGCPPVECVQPECCKTSQDCTAPALCAAPGTHPTCGACNPQPGSCNSDSDCLAFPTVSICEPIPCSCSHQRHCVPGCNPHHCAQGTVCNAITGRCEPLTCNTSGDCPGPFACISGLCVRKPCAVDSDCGDGFCVMNACFEGYGECQWPLP